MSLLRSLSRHVESGALRELTMTTNGTQLARFAHELADCGIRRINVSLDTLDATKFRAITRWGELDKVLAGIEAARKAGLAVKINAVALKNMNEEEIPSLMQWAHGNGMALTLIEVMPMGEIGEGRIDHSMCRCHWFARGSPSATRSPIFPTIPAVRRVTCTSARPAANSASSRR